MILLLAAGITLGLGAIVTLALRSNAARGFAAIASQALASVLVLLTVVPVMVTGSAATVAWRWSFPVEIVRLQIDPLSALFLSFSLPMTLLGTLYATGYLKPYFARGRNGHSHYALLNMVALSFLIIYTVQSAMVFLLGWEIAAVSAWLLVIWDYHNQTIRFAGFNYLVSTHIGLFVLAAAFMILHSQTDSMDFAAFASFLHRPSPLRSVTFVLLVTSFGLKAAFFPLHTWLPRAHSAAPSHVSALLSGVISTGAGLFGLLRFTLLMGAPEEWMGWYVVAFAALSALLGVLYTSGQRDLKRLLGYSSTENVGIAGIGIGIGMLGLAWHKPGLVLLGFAGATLHIFNHALFKCLLFYAAGAVYRATHTIDIERLGGLARRMPKTTVFFLIGALAISALPPFNGFVSEFLLYSGLLGSGAPAGFPRLLFVCVAALLAFVGAVSALSMTRAFGVAFLGQPRDPAIHVESDAPPAMLLPMLLHALGVVCLGLLPASGFWLVRPVAKLFLALLPPAQVALPDVSVLLRPITLASTLLVLVISALALLGHYARKGASRSATWGCGYSAPSPRMQFTGASFSLQFTRIFATFLPELRREKLPEGYFPEGSGHLTTHHVDAVERRMFEVLGDGESLVRQVASRIPEQPRFAFAAGLVALVVMVWLLLAALTVNIGAA